MKKNNSTPSAVIAVVTIIVFFLLSYMWILPGYKQNKTDYAKADYEVTAANAKLQSLKNSQASLNSLGSTLESILVAVPSDQDAGNIITSLEAIAAANQTYIPSFQITGGGATDTTTTATTTTAASSNTVSIVFSTTGAFEGLSGFLKDVEDNTKFFTVNSVTVSQGDSNMSMTLELEAYTQGSTSGS